MMSDNLPQRNLSAPCGCGWDSGSRTFWCRARIKGVVVSNSKVRPASGGSWVGPYWGAISFGTNTKVVKTPPKSWDDLNSSAYKGMIALDGDPRSAGDAFGAVVGAALANGGSLDNIEPGIDFFAKLKKIGQPDPGRHLGGEHREGRTPIAVQWDYANLAFKQEFKGNPPLRGHGSVRRRLRQLLLQRSQQVRRSPVRRAPLDGADLLRRRAAQLHRAGYAASGSLQRISSSRTRSRRHLAALAAAAGAVREREVPDASSRRTRPRRCSQEQWGRKVAS